jgi:MerR family transcriptional regulator, copper efflux regulator
LKRVALAQIGELATRIEEMKAMKRTLEHLAAHCRGDERPDCPILDDLAANPADARPRAPAKRLAAFR